MRDYNLEKKLALIPSVRREWEEFRREVETDFDGCEAQACACFVCGLRRGLEAKSAKRLNLVIQLEQVNLVKEQIEKEAK